MTSLVKSLIIAAVCGILVFFGITFLFLLLSLLITYYDVTMDRLVNSTCVSSSCYYPPARTILEICFVVAVIVAISIFVTVKRYESTRGRTHRLFNDLKHELGEAKSDLKHDIDKSKHGE